MTNSDECIDIAMVSSNEYAQHLAVNMISILKNTYAKTHFYVINDSLTEESKNKLSSLVQGYTSSVDFIQVALDEFKDYPTPSNIPTTLYARLLIPYLLPTTKKVIAFDVDTVIRKDISLLWNIDLESYPMAACHDCISPNRVKQIGISHFDYFNSGVLYMDLDHLRKIGIIDKFKSLQDKCKYFHDQDLWNQVINGNWKRLHQKWNCMSRLNPKHSAKYGYNYDELKEATNDPSIIHYTTTKPWDYTYSYRWRDEYWKYLALTPFKDYKCHPASLKDVIEKYFPRWLTKIVIGKR